MKNFKKNVLTALSLLSLLIWSNQSFTAMKKFPLPKLSQNFKYVLGAAATAFGLHKVYQNNTKPSTYQSPLTPEVKSQLAETSKELGVVDNSNQRFTVADWVRFGFSEEKAKEQVRIREDMDKFAAAMQKLFGPKESDEIRDEKFLQIIDMIRQHKQITGVVKVYQDNDGSYLDGKASAKTLDMLAPLAPIILPKDFSNSLKSAQVWILYHEMQHVKQARHQATTCLGDTSVEHERDADLSAAREIDCCHCLGEVLARFYEGDTSDFLDPVKFTAAQIQKNTEIIQKFIEDRNNRGYLTIEELKNIIKEKTDSGKHDMCSGHTKILFSDWYYANNESEELQDFIPNKACRK